MAFIDDPASGGSEPGAWTDALKHSVNNLPPGGWRYSAHQPHEGAYRNIGQIHEGKGGAMNWTDYLLIGAGIGLSWAVLAAGLALLVCRGISDA